MRILGLNVLNHIEKLYMLGKKVDEQIKQIDNSENGKLLNVFGFRLFF